MAVNLAAAYGNNKVNTATPAELTLMLYDGAIRFCNVALIGFETMDYEKIHNNIQKARAIIVELQTTLNHDYPVSKDFEVIYDYVFHRLVDANVKKDKQALEDALQQLRDLRNIWKQIMNAAKDPRIQGK